MHELNLFNHRIKIKVRFSDLDAMHHVNNATYLSYLEEARIAYFNDVLNLSKSSLDFGAVIARIEINYLNPILLGDDLEVLTRVVKFGNKSSDIENVLIVHRENNPIVAAKASTKLVSYDYKKGESVAIPLSVKKAVENFESRKLHD